MSSVSILLGIKDRNRSLPRGEAVTKWGGALVFGCGQASYCLALGGPWVAVGVCIGEGEVGLWNLLGLLK